MMSAYCISQVEKVGSIMPSKTIKILYFASLREQLGVSEELFELSEENTTVGKIKQLLSQRGNEWRERFTKHTAILSALNHTMVKDETCLNRNDELAFFPPVTGG